MGDRINRSNTRLRAAGCVVMASFSIDAFHGDRSAIAAIIGPIGGDDEVP
jgi:hypothetical protein